MTPLIRRIANLLDPLSEFLAERGDPLPEVEELAADEMPEPYRRLLVHDRDMTSTLEEHTGGPVRIRAIQVRRVRDMLFRQVVLVGPDNDAPVEFGAIRIHLDQFDADECALILENRLPLGAILREREIAHRSEPTAFFRIAADATMRKSFGLDCDRWLYGRHNILTDEESHLLAEVVEILPQIADERWPQKGTKCTSE